MQSVRKDPVYKTKEREAKQSVRKYPVHKTKEREAMQSVRKDTVYKTKEREAKQSVRKDSVYKTKEREAKQSVRRNLVYKTKEREAKQSARENQTYKAQQKINQNMSKSKARENPYVRECERIKKQQIRQEKRKFNDNSGIDVPRKSRKHDMDTCQKIITRISLLLKSELNNFILIYPLDPYMFVHVVTKHGLGKVLHCFRIHIFLQKVEENIALVLYLSTMRNGLVIHV